MTVGASEMSEFYFHKNVDGKTKLKLTNNNQSDISNFNQGRIDGPGQAKFAANQNGLNPNQRLKKSLPLEIQSAISEWADQLRKMPWKLRRRAIKRFSGSFADNFLANMPNLSDEEYDSLAVLGTTCMIEELDTGKPITNLDQAKCYTESVHDYHQSIGRAYLAANSAQGKPLH
jgi:hypothetical protein